MRHQSSTLRRECVAGIRRYVVSRWRSRRTDVANLSFFLQRSLVMLPSTHALHDDARKAGKHQKKYGNVYRASKLFARSHALARALTPASFPAAEDEGRPIHLLRASLPRIRQFVNERLPEPRMIEVDESARVAPKGDGDVEMKSGDIVV